MRCLSFAMLALSALASSAYSGSVLVVSDSQGQKLFRFKIDESSGQLSHLDDVAADGEPGAMAVSPDGRTLYVSLRGKQRIASFRIETGTGELSPLNDIDVGGGAVYVSTDRTGRFLLSAYYTDGRVAVHRLQEDGSLGEQVQSRDTDTKAHSIVADRSNRFVFVPHTGPEKIFQFNFDAETGRLTPNDAGNVDTSNPRSQLEPRHLWFHPTLNYAYVSMERGSLIGAYRFDPKKGTLSAITSRTGGRREVPRLVSTIPQGFTGSNTTADIEVTPDGRFAYVSNRGHDSIAGFRIDARTGEVRATNPATTSTEATPRSFNIHPSGKWMYVAGQTSGKLAAYSIDEDGGLTSIQTVPAGTSPSWVQVITIPE